MLRLSHRFVRFLWAGSIIAEFGLLQAALPGNPLYDLTFFTNSKLSTTTLTYLELPVNLDFRTS